MSRIGGFLLVLLASSALYGVEVADLYVAEVPVASQSADDLARAAKSGMLQVLVRACGSSGVINNELVIRESAHPENYYYQYSFLRTDPGPGNLAGMNQLLQVYFEPNAIARLLRDAGYPVWGSNRPNTLIWLAIETKAGRSLLSDHSDDEFVALLTAESRRRGLPLLLPLLDLEDEANITTAAVWGGFQSRVELASRRYEPDAILSGRLYQGSNGEWSGYWFYKTGSNWLVYENLSIQVGDVVAGIVDQLADALASKYALDSNRAQVQLRIDGVRNLSDYVAVSQYLQNLAPVLDIAVDQVKGPEILFSLQMQGQIEQFMEVINLDQKLVYTGRPGMVDTGELNYRWVP